MTYYPQNAPRNNQGHAPPYSQTYSPPMRQSRVNNDVSREQLPGEEWVRGPDGTFVPGNEITQSTRPRPAQPRRRPYWE